MKDPEYVAQMVAAQERAKREGKPTTSAPPMSTWSAELEQLTTIADRLGSLIYLTRAANGDKSAKPMPPMPRPETLLPKLQHERRKEQHIALADRLLGR
jgi:hypothetical protein